MAPIATTSILAPFSSLLALLILWLLLLLLTLALRSCRGIIRVDSCTSALHEIILVLWHTDETWLGTAVHTHKISGSSTHLRSAEHARSHLIATHGRLHACPEVHLHVAIFSWGCWINAIHLLLRLHHLLHLHHVLLLEYDCHPRVGRLAQLCQFGHFATISKLLDIILCGQFWGLCTPLVVLDQLLKLYEIQKKRVNTFFNQRIQADFY